MKSIILLLLLIFSLKNISAQNTNEAETIANLKRHIYTLADDSLEGRGTATEGEQKASEYITGQFKKTGLKPLGGNDSYLQPFNFTAGKEYGESNSLKINYKDKELFLEKAGEAFYPLQYSANGTAKGEIIFVRYGITAPDYDDYKNLPDLSGKIFLMELSSPDGMHPHSKYADYSDMRKKIDNAIAKGCKGIIFINTDTALENPQERNFDNKITPSSIPVLLLSKEEFMKISEGKNFVAGEATGTAEISVDLKTITKTGHNVAGFMDNGAKITIIIGAHYDHLGYGEQGSLYRGEAAIHNGADDNASGTATIIELARALKESKLKNNNYLFIAFSGEELGLYGSNHFAKNPTVKLEAVNYMLNLDMVGRLEKEKGIIINGAGTSPAWNGLLNNIKVDSLKIKTSESGVGPSDHTSFYLQNIPSLHFFTGTHEDYHKPTDDADKVNFEGMLTVEKFILALIDSLNGKEKLIFTKTKDETNENTPRFTVTLGVVPDYMYEGEGMKIDGVSDGKPAQKAGLQKGDIVLQIGEHKTVDMMSYMKALSKFKKGESVVVKVKRGDKIQDFNVTF